MDRYLIESPHNDTECRQVVKAVYGLGYLNNFDWGCKVGVHKGWVIIEADNESEAILVVPPALRNKAKAVRLNKFGPEQVKDVHET